MLKLSHGIADLNKELQQQREMSQRETASLKEKHAQEVRELTSKNLLEVELESDRVRTEMQQSIDKQDAEIQRLQQELELAQESLVVVGGTCVWGDLGGEVGGGRGGVVGQRWS